MHGDALVVVLVLVFGCAAFFFGLLYMLCRIVAWFGRGVANVFRPASRLARGGSTPRRSAVRVCPRERCRRVEYRRDARYCSQCGAPLM